MMTKEEMAQSDRLLKGLCELIQVENTGFDDNRLFGLLLDDQYKVTLLANSPDRIFIYAFLAAWPQDPPEMLGLELLSANLIFSSFFGPYIAFDPISQALILADSMDLSNELTPQKLKERIETIVQYQSHIISTLQKSDGPTVKDHHLLRYNT